MNQIGQMGGSSCVSAARPAAGMSLAYGGTGDE